MGALHRVKGELHSIDGDDLIVEAGDSEIFLVVVDANVNSPGLHVEEAGENQGNWGLSDGRLILPKELGPSPKIHIVS